jgi:hypothetical protein
VTVPERVWDELLEGDDGVDALRSFHDAGGIDIVTVDASSLFVEFRRDLDVGEAAALAFAIAAFPSSHSRPAQSSVPTAGVGTLVPHWKGGILSLYQDRLPQRA